MPRSPVEALHHILFLDFIQVKWGLVELQIMFNRQPPALIKYARSPSSLLSTCFHKALPKAREFSGQQTFCQEDILSGPP